MLSYVHKSNVYPVSHLSLTCLFLTSWASPTLSLFIKIPDQRVYHYCCREKTDIFLPITPSSSNNLFYTWHLLYSLLEHTFAVLYLCFYLFSSLFLPILSLRHVVAKNRNANLWRNHVKRYLRRQAYITWLLIHTRSLSNVCRLYIAIYYFQ